MNKDNCLLVLEKTRYCTVSTVDEEGRPWAAPVWYVFDEQMNLYWWSPVSAQHSKNITLNKNVYVTIFDSTAPEGDGLGVYVRAEASEVHEAELDAAIHIYNASTEKFKMSRENCSAPAPTRLYKAVPREMWMNDGLERDGFWQDTRSMI